MIINGIAEFPSSKTINKETNKKKYFILFSFHEKFLNFKAINGTSLTSKNERAILTIHNKPGELRKLATTIPLKSRIA